jgi:S-adenosylmethionine/arginine decarboxylase-like enzyme
MPTNRAELKRAVHTILNDVIEQCFRHLIHHPQDGDELNKLIKESTDEINYLLIKIDAHSFENGSQELDVHYSGISKDLHKKSLRLLGRFQTIQRSSINVSDE